MRTVTAVGTTLTPHTFEERGGPGCGFGYVYNKAESGRVGWSVDTDDKCDGLMVWNTNFDSAGWTGELPASQLVKVWKWLHERLIATGRYTEDQLKVRPKVTETTSK